jgi:hypothetical protein
MGSDAAALFPFSTSTTATSPRLCGATAVSHRRSGPPTSQTPLSPFHFLCIALSTYLGEKATAIACGAGAVAGAGAGAGASLPSL